MKTARPGRLAKADFRVDRGRSGKADTDLSTHHGARSSRGIRNRQMERVERKTKRPRLARVVGRMLNQLSPEGCSNRSLGLGRQAGKWHVGAIWQAKPVLFFRRSLPESSSNHLGGTPFDLNNRIRYFQAAK